MYNIILSNIITLGSLPFSRVLPIWVCLQGVIPSLCTFWRTYPESAWLTAVWGRGGSKQELLPSQPVHCCCMYTVCSSCLPLFTGWKWIPIFGVLNREIGLILFKVLKNKYAYFDVYLYHDLYDKIDFFEIQIKIDLEKQLLFKLEL